MFEQVAVVLAKVRASGADLAEHPAKPLLFLLQRGRLAVSDVETRCPTPAATLALAAKLDLDTSAIPLPP